MMDCKAALQEVGGDMEKGDRPHPASKIEGRGDQGAPANETAEGPDRRLPGQRRPRSGAIVELRCEKRPGSPRASTSVKLANAIAKLAATRSPGERRGPAGRDRPPPERPVP